MAKAFIALGSNIEPERKLPAAVAELAARATVLAASTVWQSSPATQAAGAPEGGEAGQSDYLNAAVLIETELTPRAVKAELLRPIEDALGRVRDPADSHAPRTIDLDLVLYDQRVVQADGIALPDPDIVERPYLATPLAELAPEYRHPITRTTLREIASGLHYEHPPLLPRRDVKLLPQAGDSPI